MRKKKDLSYFKSLRKVREQVIPDSMIPRTVSLIQDVKSEVSYLVDWRDKKYISHEGLEVPKDKDWDYDKKHWKKIA